MNNANREKLVALGYSPDSLTNKDIDRINQALAASSVTLGQVTELIDNMVKGWGAFCGVFKEATRDFLPVMDYYHLKTTDFLLMSNKVTSRCLYLAYYRSGKVAKKNLNRISREYSLWVKRNPDLASSKDLV